MSKYVIALTHEPLDGENYEILLSAVVPLDRLQAIYDDLPDVIQMEGEEEDLDVYLQQVRARKLACGKYLLDRDVVLHTSESSADNLVKKWQTMVDDGVLLRL